MGKFEHRTGRACARQCARRLTDGLVNVYTYIMRSNPLIVAALFAFAFSHIALGQAAAAPSLAGPTTRVLAIGHLTTGTTRETIAPVMPREVRDTVRLYLAGKLDQWFIRRDQSGVVFLLNVSTVAEAKALLEKLPLGEAKLMDFDFIPLGPLTPLNLLIQGDASSGK